MARQVDTDDARVARERGRELVPRTVVLGDAVEEQERLAGALLAPGDRKAVADVGALHHPGSSRARRRPYSIHAHSESTATANHVNA